MIHIAVVEDEPKELELISAYIRRFSIEQQLEIKITPFSDGIGIISPYRGDYDVIMLDIQMRYMDGLTAAQKIREKDENVIILFITNLAQYAIKGYAVRATNFILKPVTYFAFSEELKNVLVKLNKRQKHTIMLHTEDGVTMLNIADILFIESVGRVLKLHSKQGEFRINDTLSHLEKDLNDPRFFRCHRGCLVNLYYVERVKNNDIMIGNSVIPLSRYKREEFEDALIKIMGEAI
jgi:DNA-binding LytR/AlgR family response regulator